MSFNRNTVREQARLKLQEDDWNLNGSIRSNSSNTRTRNGGSGRPNLVKRVYNEQQSSSDSDFQEALSELSSDDELYEEEEEQEDEEEWKKPPPTRFVLEYESLKKIMEKNCRCPKCNGPVEMKVKTLCLASNVMICCPKKDCGYVDVSDMPATSEVGTKTDDRERITDFSINVLYVLGFLTSGDGHTEAARMLGLMGLPNDTTMQSRSFGIIEERISPFIQSVTKDILLDNLAEEVRLTFAQLPDKDETDLANWKNSLDPDNALVYSKAKYPAISVSFDMGWQQRSKNYNSPSGHAFFVGGYSRKPIALQIKSRVCNYCWAWQKKHPPSEDDPIPAPPHACTNNHRDGTASSMEPKAALDMMIDLFDRKHVSIARICIDDDASTPALLKWSNADYCINNNTPKPPQVQKKIVNKKDQSIRFVEEDRSDTGKLPGHIPEPAFVADPNHRKKLFTKDLRAFKTNTSVERYGMSDMDVTRLGKNYGYMIRSLKRITEDQTMVDAGKAVVEHHYDNHEYCGQWCPRKRLTEHQRNLSERYYRNKERDAKLYGIMNQIAARFIALPKLKELAHVMDTQVNESMNNTISWLAPKNKCYAGSQSLRNRISIAVGINSLGLHRYFTRLFSALGITMTPNVEHFLNVRDRTRQKRIQKTKDKEQKKLRKEKVKRNERKKKYGTYRTGTNMEDPEQYGWWVKSPTKKRTKGSLQDIVCRHCGLTGHSRTSSQACLKHKSKPKPTDLQQVQEHPNDSEEDAASDLDREEGLTLVEHLQMFPADADADALARKNNSNDDDKDSEVQEVHIL
jgi:hypothetical protein